MYKKNFILNYNKIKKRKKNKYFTNTYSNFTRVQQSGTCPEPAQKTVLIYTETRGKNLI